MAEFKTIPNDVFFEYVCRQLQQGYTVNVPLTGTSMRPLLQEGRDNLVLSPLPPNTPLRKYDVVLFRYNGNYVLHRIVRFDGNTVIIRGDALLSFEMVSPTDIIAILTAVQNIKTGKITNCKSLKWKYLSLKTVWSKQLKRKIKKLLVKRTTKY